ncbi:MAG: hypothetical protein QW717_03140 [Candidatus Bathyarchaeia archaeon]
MAGLELNVNRRELGLRIIKAFLLTVAYGFLWLLLWFLTSSFPAFFPYYSTLFPILAWGLLFFTFAIKMAEGTIYKYVLIILRAFFLIAYLVYATNSGVLTVKVESFVFTFEFLPLLAVMIIVNLLEVARGIIQAIEFASQSADG